MKRTLLLLVFAIASLGNAMAQHEPWDIYITPKVGAAYSNFRGVDGGKYKLGFVGGANLEVFITPAVAFDTEISFSHQGSHNYINPETQIQNDARVNLLNFDFMFRFYPIRSIQRLSLFSGLHGAYVAWFKVNYRDIRDEVHGGDIGVPVGIGYEVGKVAIDAKYNFSARKIAHTEMAKRSLGDATHSALMLTIGYKIQVF